LSDTDSTFPHLKNLIPPTLPLLVLVSQSQPTYSSTLLMYAIADPHHSVDYPLSSLASYCTQLFLTPRTFLQLELQLPPPIESASLAWWVHTYSTYLRFHYLSGSTSLEATQPPLNHGHSRCLRRCQGGLQTTTN